MTLRVVAAAPLAALVLAGCGAGGGIAAHSSGATTPAPQLDPKDAVLTAVHHATGTSFQADMSMTISFSTSASATGNVAALDGQSLTVHMQLQAESPQRNRVDATTTVHGTAVHAVAILYDGTLYTSNDGGKTFKSVSLSSLPTGSYGEDTALTYLQNVATVTDQGAAEVDGVQVEDYHAELDAAKLEAAVRALLSGTGGGSALNRVFNSLTLTDGHVDAFVDSTGRIISETGTIDARFDLGAIDPSLAGQSVGFNEGFTGDFHDYGTPVTVAPPAHGV